MKYRPPQALALAKLTRFCEPFAPTTKRARRLGRREVGVLFEEAARIFFDDGVKVLAAAGEGVERVDGRWAAVVRNRVVA
jgi:hypothetical protein